LTGDEEEEEEIEEDDDTGGTEATSTQRLANSNIADWSDELASKSRCS
jgi:hypothetical protein